MDKKIILFSGMPASGKDTITNRLTEEDGRFVAFKRHRAAGEGGVIKDTYYNITDEEFDRKIKNGEFVQYHTRYDRQYGVDKRVLLDILENNQIPIIHNGRIENFYVFESGIRKLEKEENIRIEIIHVLLWEELDVLQKRLNQREKTEEEKEARIRAAKEELQDNKRLLEQSANPYSFIIKNSNIEHTVRAIREIVDTGTCSHGDGYLKFMAYVSQSDNLNEEGENNTLNNVSITCTNRMSNYKVKSRVFSRNVQIDNLNPDNEDVLEFENCVFQNVKLSKIGCPEIRFVNCTVHGEIIIHEGTFNRIVIRSCEKVNRIIIDQVCKLSTDKCPQIKIMNSDINEIKVIDSNLDSMNFDDVNSNCNQILFKKIGGINKINVSCSIGLLSVKTLPEIVISKEGEIENIELEKIDRSTLRKNEKKVKGYNTDKHLFDDYNRYKSVVIACYESFERRKMFPEADKCLFEIRRLGLIEKKYAMSPMFRPIIWIEKFFAEICFGWGIVIKNNILTMLCVIFGFGFTYHKISVINEMNLTLLHCVEIAIDRFFLIDADAYTYTFFTHFDSAESVLGVILLTVITGVLVRKIIR